MVRLVAFDIDGALDTQEGARLFAEEVSKQNTEVGIVSARGEAFIDTFIKVNELDADYATSAVLKGQALKQIADNHDNVEQKKYYGSWVRDKLHAKVAGWDYEQLGD